MWGIETSAIMRWAVRVSLVTVVFAPGQLGAADVRLTGSVGTQVTASDNVDLEPDGQANSGLIWTNTGSFGLREDGERLHAAVDYTLSIDTTFSDGTDVDVRNDLNAIGTLEVIPDLFYLEGRAFAGQRLVGANGRVSGNGTNVGSDTADVYSFTVNPFFHFRLGTWADADIGAEYERVFVTDNKSEEGSSGDSVSTSQHAKISSEGKLARTNLAAEFEHDKVNTDGPGNDSEQTTGLTTAEYALIPEFSLLGTVGYEVIDTNSFQRDLSGVVVYGGFDARPGPRSELRFQVGHRFDQIVYDALASYKLTSHMTFQSTYGVSFVPAAGDALSLPTNIMLDKNGNFVDVTTGLPVNPIDVGLGLEDQPYVSNRADASLVGSYTRDQFSLTGTFERRDFQTQEDEDVLEAAASWTHDLSRDLRVGSLLGYRRTDITMGEKDDTIIGRVDVSYDLAENAVIFAAYSYTQRFSNVPDDEYAENALTIGASLRF